MEVKREFLLLTKKGEEVEVEHVLKCLRRECGDIEVGEIIGFSAPHYMPIFKKKEVEKVPPPFPLPKILTFRGGVVWKYYAVLIFPKCIAILDGQRIGRAAEEEEGYTLIYQAENYIKVVSADVEIIDDYRGILTVEIR